MREKYLKVFYIGKEAVLVLLFACLNFYLMESFHHNPFADMKGPQQLLNIVLFIGFAVFFWMLTGSRKWAMGMESAAALIWGLADYYVISFRGTPVVPWDLFSISTAASVAGEYNYGLDKRAVITILGFIGIFLLEILIPEKRIAGKYWTVRICGALLGICCLFGEYAILQNDQFLSGIVFYDKLFTPYAMIKRDGIATAFLYEIQFLAVHKPEGYDADEAEEVYEALRDDIAASNDRKPNIIVVMDEAFSDPAVLGDFETNIDYMPFIHSLQEGKENTVTGTMNVSVVGGNTANTEFEFLTGSSMVFLPDGSIPYQQYIDAETDSMASYVRELGYSTIALHPYNATGWDRNEAYPALGFDNFYSLKNFSNTTKVREYVSDDSCADRIIQEFERRKGPCFIFTVTMQNHSPYTGQYDNFTPDVTVEGSDSAALSQYLSLIRLSDAALEKLISYFSEVEEDTVIVFFGDHQPTDSVVRDIWTLNGIDPGELTEEQQCLRYQVPFVVWANYDIEEQQDIVTSANFLGAQVFEWCGIPLSGYQKFLLSIQEDYAAITARTIIDKKGNLLEYEEIKEDLSYYNMLEYYRLFG